MIQIHEVEIIRQYEKGNQFSGYLDRADFVLVEDLDVRLERICKSKDPKRNIKRLRKELQVN